jgi:hypothetical protein
MLFDAFDDLNWLAVIVSALAFWVLGAVYYSDALFGKQWKAAAGVEEMNPNATQIVGNLITWLISAIALGLIAKSIGADNVGDGLVLGLVAAFGFIGMNRLTEALYTDFANRALIKVNAPYNLAGYLIMGVILATWT